MEILEIFLTFSPLSGLKGAGLSTIVLSVRLSRIGGPGVFVGFGSPGIEFSKKSRRSSIWVLVISFSAS